MKYEIMAKHTLREFMDTYEADVVVLYIGTQEPVKINLNGAGSYAMVKAFEHMKFSFVAHDMDSKLLALNY